MIVISIGNEQVTADDFNAGWAHEQSERRKRDGRTVCTRIEIQEGDVDIVLSTPECGATGGSGRAPRPSERRIFDLWDELGLNEAGCAPGKLVAFVNRMKNLI